MWPSQMTLLSSALMYSRDTFPDRDAHTFPLNDKAPDIPTLPVTSTPRGMIQVLGYTPREGERGVPITVHINYNRDSLSSVYIRLLVGQRPVATTVRQLNDANNCRWTLDAIAPAPDRYSRSPRALLTVQALGKNDTVLDSVTFGEFVYWVSGSS
ncbi:hypothetical protein HGRIS_002247 [Hohenbuehelia grisea]|uniref:Uncharacterized protein n=1 Tax=Hohenbuehelia grisea TaxID=104357 RepID=A0ABR3JLA5_9AGAR